MNTELFVIVLLAILVIVGFIVGVKAGMAKMDKQASQLNQSPADANSGLPEKPAEKDDLLWIEYVPAGLYWSKTLFTATAKVQTELLVAGDALLGGLSANARHSLRRPISCDIIDLLSLGGNPESLTPERVKAAIGVAQATLAIQALMYKFSCEANRFCWRVALDDIGYVIAGEQRHSVDCVVERISCGVKVDYFVAAEIWYVIKEILFKDVVPIPGMMAKKDRIVDEVVKKTG